MVWGEKSAKLNGFYIVVTMQMEGTDAERLRDSERSFSLFLQPICSLSDYLKIVYDNAEKNPQTTIMERTQWNCLQDELVTSCWSELSVECEYQPVQTSTIVREGKSKSLMIFSEQTLPVYYLRNTDDFFHFQLFYKNWKRKQMENMGQICADL